ncbi:Predicted membrane protein [Chryseobacterium soldanellicola]|uniref:Predicted membrane protein n=1 Tax=Chryseobacterium soldanellicola TaxID=311333 RepID=A0A1H0XQY0_9FLAO|nr:DUF2339 domain-containing protein [Chryseobacterium soldanellicola]SDQ05285.1 Predicted membrane protein [Chryseobacterium soldanellicola]
MEFTLIIILIIVVLFIFNNLNSKIQRLEKKISELTQTFPEKSEQLTEKKIAPQNGNQEAAFKTSFENTVHLQETEIKPQKDWVTPIFDFFKQNALTIIGIFTLVLGIGYFVKYAIDKNWIGETARVGIGLAIGVGIIVIGHFLRKNYTVFSSIITGGGIAVLYFTTTIAFREYHLFTQNTAFVITCCITLFSIVLSYYYKSEVLIIFSLFGGFLAPLMISTGQSNYPFLFTYLTVLNIGMLIIVFLNNWKSVGWIAFFFTNIYLFYWTSEKTEIISICFYIITYIIFYIFALLDYYKKNILSSWNILMLILINFSSIIGLVYIFNKLQYEPVIIFPIIFSFVNGFLLFKEYRRKKFGINYSVFAGITISLLTAAFALQFKTHLITSVWAIEATLLLYIWKKSGHSIFKICFYVLFPLVIIAQIFTWVKYLDSQNLEIILNPIFLTSFVTAITTFFNIFLLKNYSEKETTSFFENLFSVVSYTVIYFALLLEIIYHISEKPAAIIWNISLLFSIYYLFILLLFRKKLEISKTLQTGFIYLFILLLINHVSFSGLSLVSGILVKKISINYYFLHLSYLIPFVWTGWKIISQTDFFKGKFSYWVIGFILTFVISFELYHLYILGNAKNLSQSYSLIKHFNILYLPIIWAVLASIFIYIGLKKDIPEFNKVGFVLLGIMILKLYAHDVWQMDNVSRIIAFIILGIILLLSSFTFQRLKNIITNLVEKKNESVEDENSQSQ